MPAMHSWLSVPHSQRLGTASVSGRTLYGLQPRQMLALAEEHAHVRSEEFISGTDQEVAVERGHVDQAVRPIVHGVDIGERPAA